MDKQQKTQRVLIIYFSLSGQVRGLVNLLAQGLRSYNITIHIEQIQTTERIGFPFRKVIRTFLMMLTTFFRSRIPIKPLSTTCFASYDLIILAGPTWSYNPCGPILSLFDRNGKALFSGNRVLPLISCRGYYRLHDFLLRRQLERFGALLEKSLIFTHPVSEPWSTIGVFLKSAGYSPESLAWLEKHYPHFGHTLEQLNNAKRSGCHIGRALLRNQSVGSLLVNQADHTSTNDHQKIDYQ